MTATIQGTALTSLTDVAINPKTLADESVVIFDRNTKRFLARPRVDLERTRNVHTAPNSAAREMAATLPGLLAGYSFDETLGVTAFDFSGNGYHAAVSKVVPGQPGIDGYCYAFDGIYSHINLNAAGLLSALDGDTFSFAIWLRTPQLAPWTDGLIHYLFRLDSDAGCAFALYKSAANNTLIANYYSSPTNAAPTIAITPTTGWHHIAVTVSNGSNRMRVYLDGVLQGTESALGTAWSGTFTTAVIGAINTSATAPWNGLLDEALIYNRELSAGEVAILASITPNTPSPRITFMGCGDSKTAGEGDLTSPYPLNANGYLRILGALTGWQELPRNGVSGRTVATAKAAIDAELAVYLYAPDFILCNFGANDALALPAAATWKANYKYYLQAWHAKSPTSKIYIARPQRDALDAECNLMAAYITALVADPDLAGYCYLGIDERTFWTGSSDDGVHPNRAGHVTEAVNWKTKLGV